MAMERDRRRAAGHGLAVGYNRAGFYTPATVDCPMDIIFIEEMRAETWIGIYPREKAMPQTVEISLHIGVSTTSAGASDDIRDTVDYAVVVERLRKDLAGAHFNLLEKLTEHIATFLLENFAAQWVRVSVAKLGMMPGVKRVGVTIERSV
jgi:dihydroneopterin aldolase